MRPMNARRFWSCVGGAAAALGLAAGASAQAEGEGFDFDGVTELARGIVAGRNVQTPVPGFELLFMKDGRVVYDQAFGAWVVGGVANADSATKTLSGALVMSVTERSARPFSLDTRLSELIPQFSGAKQNITVRQCFSHMAGFGGNSTAVSNPLITLQQAALQIAADPLRYVPGSTFSYGGVSMHAAGAAAELAGGQSWSAMFDQRMAGPLGMARTRYVLSGPNNPRIAGGCESTAAEFATFMEMLRRGGVHDGTRILSSASVDAMFTRQTPVGVPIANSPLEGSSDYGVGVWLDQRDAQGRLIGAIAAGARGFSCWIDFDDGMVGAFATDLSASGNVIPALNLVRAAAEQVVRAPMAAGDANADGVVDAGDLAVIARSYGGSERLWAQGDFTGDGRVDGADLALARRNYADPLGFDAAWRSALHLFAPCVAADFDQDGVLNPDDLSDFVGAYFGPASGPRADHNGDGIIDPDDLSDFIADYFTCPG